MEQVRKNRMDAGLQKMRCWLTFISRLMPSLSLSRQRSVRQLHTSTFAIKQNKYHLIYTCHIQSLSSFETSIELFWRRRRQRSEAIILSSILPSPVYSPNDFVLLVRTYRILYYSAESHVHSFYPC